MLVSSLYMLKKETYEENYEALYSRKWQAKVTRINKISYLFSLIKRGPGTTETKYIWFYMFFDKKNIAISLWI